MAGRLEALRRVNRALGKGAEEWVFDDLAPRTTGLRGGKSRIVRRGESGSVVSPRHCFAVMRSVGGARDDLVAIEHPPREPETRVELFAGGRSWLGDWWRASSASGGDEPSSRVKWMRWKSEAQGDVAEWSIGQGRTVITRSVVLLKRWKVALLADLVEGAEGGRITQEVDVRAGVRTESGGSLRALVLRSGRMPAALRVCPLALPASNYHSERGRMESAGSSIQVSYAAQSSKTWLPVLISWDHERDRGGMTWRALTVTQNRKVCRAGVAFAVRVGWPRRDGLVIYRSLARPALRSFLGHQTEARMLVGKLSMKGDLEPLIRLD
jgi:hypothetical protein